jgi:endonuclease/exonuclease/phosphatase (EEP) superfamily protein YafD
LHKLESNEAGVPAGLDAVRRKLGTAAVISISLVLAATVCAATASFFWVGDLATHFRLQYAVLSLLCVIALVWMRRPYLTLLALAALLVNITTASVALRNGDASEHSATAVASAVAVPESKPALSMASINVFYRNRQYQKVIDFLQEQRPDVVVLVEITPQWRQALEPLAPIYAHRYFSASSPIQRMGARIERGVLLLSRWPIVSAEPIDFGEWAEPGVRAKLDVQGRPVNVMGVHPCWPMGWRISAERNRELAHIAELARSTPAPLVVLGDMNITSFSPHFQSLLAQSGLRSAVPAMQWLPTWPTFLPIAGIQIDHALVSPGVTVRGVRRGPRVGSDHWPIVVDLAL